MPDTAGELSAWIADRPRVGPSQAQREAISFLASPPLALPVRAGYSLLFHAAAATLPDRIAAIAGIRPAPGAHRIGSAAISGLRWALGSSPSWHIALVRAGAPVPARTFRQPLPDRAVEMLAAPS